MTNEPKQSEGPTRPSDPGNGLHSTAVEDLQRAAEELAQQLAERESLLRREDESSPYAIRLGASNAPFDCSIYSGDYRERLPEDDPVRHIGGELRSHGSDDAAEAMKAAHEAGLAVARRSMSRF